MHNGGSQSIAKGLSLVFLRGGCLPQSQRFGAILGCLACFAPLTGMLTAQVLSFSGGQRKEEDLTSALVAAVADARREAGTYGIETPGEHSRDCSHREVLV